MSHGLLQGTNSICFDRLRKSYKIQFREPVSGTVKPGSSANTIGGISARLNDSSSLLDYVITIS